VNVVGFIFIANHTFNMETAFMWLNSSRKTRATDRNRPRRPSFRHGFECLEGRRMLSTLPVTSTLDDATQRGTLRYAVAHAGNGDTILLAPTVQSNGITLTQGELLLGQTGLTIKSVGNAPVTISGGGASRIFEVAPGANITLSNLLITGGNGLAGILNRPHEDRGGGILIDELSTLTIKSSTVTNNSAVVLGGGIADYGTLTVNNSTVSDNHALGTYGGGIAVFSGAPFSAPFSATLTVSDSTVSDNTALQNGGGIAGVSSTVTLNNCSVTGNSTQQFAGGGLNNHGGNFTVSDSVVANNTANGFGGGIQNYIGSTLTVGNSEVYGNSAGNAGGIDNSGTLTLRDSQLSHNATSIYGGGIFNENSGIISMMHDLLTENTASAGGAIFSYGNITIRDSTLSSNSAGNSGGAIENGGTLAVNHTVLSHNSAYYGGAIANGGTMTIFASEISYNSAENGGGIINFGMLTIGDSQICQNIAAAFYDDGTPFGGGIDNEQGTVTLSGSLLSGNSAPTGIGGGIMNWDTMTIDDCTLSNNTAVGGIGGGICNFGSTLTVRDSIFSANTPDNINGPWTDLGGNTF
jgi:hypothetical protein